MCDLTPPPARSLWTSTLPAGICTSMSSNALNLPVVVSLPPNQRITWWKSNGGRCRGCTLWPTGIYGPALSFSGESAGSWPWCISSGISLFLSLKLPWILSKIMLEYNMWNMWNVHYMPICRNANIVWTCRICKIICKI